SRRLPSQLFMLLRCVELIQFFFFFFSVTTPTEIYTLSLHDALPICAASTVSTASWWHTPVNGVLARRSRAKRRHAAKRHACISVASISITSRVKTYSSVRFHV